MWSEEKKGYLGRKETVQSVHEARLQLSLLEQYEDMFFFKKKITL
jgi:hypothetical protein